MPDEIDYDAYMPKAPVPVAPLPEVAPAPVAQSGGIDYDSFMPGRTGAQSPGFNMAKFLGPAPVEPAGPIQTQTDTTPAITPAQASDFKATKIWRALELERQDMQANPEPVIGRDGGPAPAKSNYLDEYPVSKALAGAPSATFAQLQNSLRESAGLAQSLPVQGLGSQFASGLGSGFQKLGSGLGYGGPSPDGVDAADRAANANFATPKPGWDSMAGWRDQAGQAANSLGATTPMLLGLMATRGRTLPMMGPMVGLGAEAGAANFAYNAATDPHMTPQQNLAESIIEGVMTPLGGKFEPGFAKTPLAKVPVHAFGETLEEGLTSGLQSVSGQRLDPNGDGSVNWRQVGNEATVGGMAGGAASVGLSGPGAAKDALVNRTKLDLAAMQTPYSQQEHTVPLPPKYQPGESKRLEALWNNLGVQDPSKRIDQRTLESTPTAPVTTDTTAGYQDPTGPQREWDFPNGVVPEDKFAGFDPEQLGLLGRSDGLQETVAAEAVQEARAQQDTAPDIASDTASYVAPVYPPDSQDRMRLADQEREGDPAANAAEDERVADAHWRTYQRNGGVSGEPVSQQELDDAEANPGAFQNLIDALRQDAEEWTARTNFEKSMGSPDAGKDKGVQGREQRSAAKTQVFTPEQLARQKSEVQAANNDKAHQEYLDRQAAQQDEAPVRQASPKTAETQVDLAPVGQVPVAKPSQGKLDFQSAPEQGPAQPSPAKPGQARIDFATKQPDGPAPAAPAAKAPLDLGPLVEPAPDKQRITPAPRPRGTGANVGLTRQHFGAPGFAQPVPESMKPDKVRAFKDASTNVMEVSKPVNGVALAYDKRRDVAIVVVRTDSKGRKNPNGTEWRAMAADGTVSYVGEPGVAVHKATGGKSAIEAANAEMAKTTAVGVAPATTTDEASPGRPVQGVEIPVDKDDEADGPAPARRSVDALSKDAKLDAYQKELKALDLKSRGMEDGPELDAILARTDALELEIPALKAAIAKADQAPKAAPAPKDQSKADKAKENSPLTPRLRKNFGDNITQDDLASMPPRQVGQMIEQFLTDGLGKKPTKAEVGAAIRDLEGHELLQPGQAVVPGTSVDLGANGGNLFSDPMTKWVVDTANQALGRDAAKILENAISDISMDQSIQVDVKHENRPGSFAYRYNTAIHAVTRALNWTGPLGNWIERTLARQILGVPVDLVAQSHPAFRPVLAAVREQMDVGRQRIAEAADRLTPLTSSEGEEYERVKGALISFRLEGKNGRAKADFGNPVHYMDEMDRPHVYTLTPKELDVVEKTFAANKTLLKSHVEGLLEALGLPTNLTHKALVRGIANGTIPPGAKIVDEMLHTLETGSDSYVPLRRRGPNVVLVYDQTKYRVAKNASQRKAALLSTSNTTTLDQTRKAVSNALHAHPTALITVHDRGPLAAVTPEEEVSERDLLDLAESAGVSPGVLQMFMSSGVADYFATRGTKARFVGANKMSGFDHDMKSVNVDHAVQMTHALMSIKYGRKVEDALRLKALGGDKALQKFAQHYVNSQTAPTPWGISNIKQFEIAHYLGGAAISALFNTATSFLTAPSYALQMSFNPVQSLKFFGEAAKQHARGTLALVGRGHLYGKSRAQISADAWKATNPAMAKAILDAGHAGLYEGKYDSSIDDLAKYGEVRGITKVSQVAMNGLMHMFSVAETGNRLSSFVAAYQMFEAAQSAFKASKDQFYGMAKKDNLSVDSAAAFARDFTNFVHHRNDKTEGSTITRGSADKSGVFQNSTWRQALFILKGYAINTAVQQLRIAKSAVSMGLISSAVYAGIALSHIMLFGALNVIPGASTLAAIKDHFSDSPQTTKDRMQNHGALGAIGSTGLLGHTVGKGSPLAGKYLDIVSQRVNNGGAIPSDVGANTFVPIASFVEVTHAYDDVMSGDTARQVRGAASVLRSTKSLAEYGVAASEGSGKTSTTGATVVAGKGKGDIITKANGGKIKMPELTTLDLIAGAVGITPPVVSDAYEAIAEETKRKAANDKMFSLLTHRGAAAVYLRVGSPERVKAFQDIGRDLAEWNTAAKKAGRPTDIILPVTLGHGIRMEREAQGSGAFNLKRTQKLGRPEAVKALDEVAPENRPTE